MDNVTHTLIGLAVGEAATQARLRVNRDTATRRTLFWSVSAAANNLPDLDFVLGPISGGKLGYLLQHRGFTHTLVGAIPEALLLLFIFRRWGKDQSLRRWTLGLAIVGLILHISMDAMNSYGVHPLWPFDRRWFYGDTLFIVEPTIWMALLPAIAFASQSIFVRVGAIGIGVAACLLVWFTPFVPWPQGLVFTLGGAAWWGILRKRSPLFRATFALYGWLGVVAGFSFLSARVRHAVAEDHLRQKSEFRLNDTILSPMPVNPLCWTVITFETQRDAAYRMKTGVFAPFPSVFPPQRCPLRKDVPGTLALAKAEASGDPRFRWRGSYTAPLAPLRRARQQYCGVGALMHFARAPFVIERQAALVAGDLRYDRGGGGFAEITVHSPHDLCPRYVPDWTEPRAEIFR